jgi:hypothetical protein
MAHATSADSVAHPVQVSLGEVGPQPRWSVLLRLPLVLPVILFTSLLNYGTILAIWAAVLAKGRIPTWLFDFQAGVHRWQVRAISFALLLVSEYPAFEGEYPVAYVIEHPDRVARWKLVVWKGLTAIPHFIALLFLSLSMVAVGVVARHTLSRSPIPTLRFR